MRWTSKKLPAFILCSLFFCFFISPAFAAFSTDSPELNSRINQVRENIKSLRNERDTSLSPSINLSPTPIKSVQALTSTTTLNESGLTPIVSGPTVKVTSIPTPLTTSTLTDIQGYIMQEINKFRASSGLSSVKTSKETCDFAKTRAQEISISFNHNGFNNRLKNHTVPYAHWTKITENIAKTSNYKNVVSLWAKSSGHAANMRADMPFVCVAQYGNFYAYEGMKP